MHARPIISNPIVRPGYSWRPSIEYDDFDPLHCPTLSKSCLLEICNTSEQQNNKKQILCSKILIKIYQNPKYYVKITNDYETFVKQFYCKICKILGRAFCILSSILCRVDLVLILRTLSRLLRGATESQEV